MASRYPRSPYDEIQGIVYFPRMLDKIRLFAAGDLQADYHENLGLGFDGRCCRFLGIDYSALRETALSEKSDAEVLEWTFAHGRRPSAEEIEIWSAFMRKRGWQDSGSSRLERRKKESGFENRPDIETMFALHDAEEGRSPAGSSARP